MTHYELLGVSPVASDAVIRAAYRKLARVHHPDAGGDAEQMGLVNEAYDVLRAGRAAYDRSLAAPEPVAGPEPDVPPAAWGTEESEWVEEVTPGARHRADDVPEPVVDAQRMRQRTRTHWIVAGSGAAMLIGTIAVILGQWEGHAASSGGWKLMVFPIIIAGAIQLFRRELGLKIQAILALGMLIPLGATGIWVLGPAWEALGPYTGVGLAMIGPFVWTIRIAMTGWNWKKKK